MHKYAAYVTEFIGAFFLVFTVGTSVLSGTPLAPLAIGAVMMVMVYAGAHVSGGHYNPSLTIGVFVRRRIDLPDAIAYWVAQIAGGVVGAVVAYWVMNPTGIAPMDVSGRRLVTALLVELLFTFALAYVMLNVATSRSNPNNSFYGLAIGFTVAAGAIAVGRISGAAFNPAVTIGAAVMGLLAWHVAALYLVVQVIAGVVAGSVFLVLNPDEQPSRVEPVEATQAPAP
ncbi:aquaporin Z [Dactylosporangium fulvum]|uniref:Aquaporin n=1 Tax=Dactylosporangium fulvum TaxID=53359 RepID=A0ABY5VTJ8_9ACTN|nr:aquaporin [Dactylosporangium fulvum]UWP79136.1 aquaporin [Dactylosporangium fulvum]